VPHPQRGALKAAVNNPLLDVMVRHLHEL